MESTIASMTKEEVLKISLTCGKLLLTSGAETYRVEDTMTRICALRDMQIAAVSTPSWIMVGDETVDGTSMVSRVTRRGTDLTLISEVNNISYHMPTWDHSFAETMAMLDELSARPSPTALYSMVWSGFAGGFFAGVIGGNFWDFVAAFLWPSSASCGPSAPAVFGKRLWQASSSVLSPICVICSFLVSLWNLPLAAESCPICPVWLLPTESGTSWPVTS